MYRSTNWIYRCTHEQCVLIWYPTSCGSVYRSFSSICWQWTFSSLYGCHTPTSLFMPIWPLELSLYFHLFLFPPHHVFTLAVSLSGAGEFKCISKTYETQQPFTLIFQLINCVTHGHASVYPTDHYRRAYSNTFTVLWAAKIIGFDQLSLQIFSIRSFIMQISRVYYSSFYFFHTPGPKPKGKFRASYWV